MSLKYENHIKSIEQSCLPADATDMEKLEKILHDAFDSNSESRHYHADGKDKWYGGNFKAINMKDDIADNIYERIGHHAIAFDPVLSDMALTHRELFKLDMPFLIKLIDIFTDQDMSKIGGTKVI